MKTRTIQAKVLLGEGMATVDKSVVFDLSDIGGIFMVENVNEWFELDDTCIGCNNTVSVKGWVYKNVAYKEVPNTNYALDNDGNPIFWGPINHITTRIPVQACVVIEPTKECRCCEKYRKLCESDNVEVAVSVSSCSDQLLDPQPFNLDIYPPLSNYNKLEELVSVTINIQVYRWEDVEIPFDCEC